MPKSPRGGIPARELSPSCRKRYPDLICDGVMARVVEFELEP